MGIFQNVLVIHSVWVCGYFKSSHDSLSEGEHHIGIILLVRLWSVFEPWQGWGGLRRLNPDSYAMTVCNSASTTILFLTRKSSPRMVFLKVWTNNCIEGLWFPVCIRQDYIQSTITQFAASVDQRQRWQKQWEVWKVCEVWGHRGQQCIQISELEQHHDQLALRSVMVHK